MEKSELKIIRYTLRALQAERLVDNKKLMKLYQLGELSHFPNKSKYFMDCEYTLHTDDITPDWDSIITFLKKDFDYPLANFLILAALGHQEIRYIDNIRDQLLSKPLKNSGVAFSRSITMVAAAYYRSGEKTKLQQLNKDVSFDTTETSWKIYMAFGQNKIMEAMNYRGQTIKNTFMRFYPYKRSLLTAKKKEVLTPEKDICGEAFNSLFYPELYKEKGDYIVICDERLFTILQRTFSFIKFIPKTPRYLQYSNVSNFNSINYGLRDFLDNQSFQKTKGSDFFTIDYEGLYKRDLTQQGRCRGWLKTDDSLKNYWRAQFGSSQKLIGISANSTLRSRIRDMHMIGMEFWGGIFNLPNCVFINLNASLSDTEINHYRNEFGIKLINPEIDLFNDFDNLLAIMSILDFSIVPANNLMDFSAAVGINTVVFSPSNIMKTWAVHHDRYIFSDKVKFIFPQNDGANQIEEMVLEGADYISETLAL